jgi:hypothetical protein
MLRPTGLAETMRDFDMTLITKRACRYQLCGWRQTFALTGSCEDYRSFEQTRPSRIRQAGQSPPSWNDQVDATRH